MKTNLEKTCATLGILSRGELVELAAVIERLLEATDPTDQTAPDNPQVKQPDPKAARGYVELKTIPKKGKDGLTKAYGPYKYLRYKEAGRHKSIYIGKVIAHE